MARGLYVWSGRPVFRFLLASSAVIFFFFDLDDINGSPLLGFLLTVPRHDSCAAHYERYQITGFQQKNFGTRTLVYFSFPLGCKSFDASPFLVMIPSRHRLFFGSARHRDLWRIVRFSARHTTAETFSAVQQDRETCRPFFLFVLQQDTDLGSFFRNFQQDAQPPKGSFLVPQQDRETYRSFFHSSARHRPWKPFSLFSAIQSTAETFSAVFQKDRETCLFFSFFSKTQTFEAFFAIFSNTINRRNFFRRFSSRQRDLPIFFVLQQDTDL